MDSFVTPGRAPSLFDVGREARRVHRRNAATQQGAEDAMDKPPGTPIDQRQRGRDQGMIRGSEADFLRNREPKHHSRLAVVGKPLPGRAVDQSVEVGQASQSLAGDRDRQRSVRRGQVARAAARGIERLAAAKHGVEHLQGRPARADTLSAWHGASRCSSW
jgi:hypothetical protein